MKESNSQAFRRGFAMEFRSDLDILRSPFQSVLPQEISA